MHEPIEFTIVSTVNEVDEILQLQAANHPSALTPEAMARQGFVTVRHDRDVLRRMNEAAPAREIGPLRSVAPSARRRRG